MLLTVVKATRYLVCRFLWLHRLRLLVFYRTNVLLDKSYYEVIVHVQDCSGNKVRGAYR